MTTIKGCYCSFCEDEIRTLDLELVFDGKAFCTSDCLHEYQDEQRSHREEMIYDLQEAREEDYPIDGVGFADPGGNSALRAATENNPRNLPCPSCGRKNMLTRIDRMRGYQCDYCANAAEGGFDY